MADASKIMTIDVTSYQSILDTDIVDLSTVMGLDINAYVSIGRGVFAGGTNVSSVKIDVIQYIQIDTLSDASDFGDLTEAKTACGTASNGAKGRALVSGGNNTTPATVADIEYLTVNSAANSVYFGDLTVARQTHEGGSNNTTDRAVFGGGYTTARVDTIDYCTVSSTGNASDFGDLSTARYALACCDNGTNDRATFCGGKTTSSSTFTSITDYITISSAGNATSAGALTATTGECNATSNLTNERGIIGGGVVSGTTRTDKIEYITINTGSSGTDFGDLTVAKMTLGSCSNGTLERGIFAGGTNQSSVAQDEIEYVTINSAGNSISFGLLIDSIYNMRGTSDA